MPIKCDVARYALYWAMFVFILSVSCLDLYLTVRFQHVIDEKNAFGRWLIWLEGGNVGVFCAVKMFGTCLALGILKKIWLLKRSWGWAIGCGLCLAQAVLLWFLFS